MYEKFISLPPDHTLGGCCSRGVPGRARVRFANLTGDVGRAVLARLHGPRRPRVCARKVKSPLSRWNKHPEGKPRTCHRITSVTSNIDPGHYQPPTPTEIRDKHRRTLTPRHCP